jgi:hypothetical protein
MKKIITLLFFVGAFATSFAQNRRDDQYASNRSYGRDGNNYGRNDRDWRYGNRGNMYSAKARDFQIEKINRNFDCQVQEILNDPYMRHREKKAAIRNAKIEKARQIQMVNDRFNCN